MRLLSLLLTSVLCAACGSSVESPTTTSDGGTDAKTDVATADGGASAFCKQLEERDVKCNPGDTFDAAQCTKMVGCYNTAIRAEERESVFSCLVTRTCDTSDDSCFAATKYASDPTVQAYSKACLDKRTACSNSFSDICAQSWAMFTDELREKTKACLAKPCAEVFDCFLAATSAAGCGK